MTKRTRFKTREKMNLGDKPTTIERLFAEERAVQELYRMRTAEFKAERDQDLIRIRRCINANGGRQRLKEMGLV